MTDPGTGVALSERDREYLRRCVELAREALENGHQPYGSLLVDADGTVLFEDRNADTEWDATRHPEFEIARWAAANLPPERRPGCTVYTTGEHCPMCSAAHALAGLGRIVYASSSAQTGEWYGEWGIEDDYPVAGLPIQQVAPGIEVDGPDPELSNEVRALHARRLGIDWEPPKSASPAA